MTKYYKTSRVAALFVAMGLLLAIYMTSLYKLQLYDTGAQENAVRAARNTTTHRVALAASRGSILDRNGVELVSTRPAYNVALSREALRPRKDINDIILSLVYDAIDSGVAYVDTFPVTIGAPFSYLNDMDNDQKTRLKSYFDYFSELDENMSASDLFVWMKRHYGIDYTTSISDARLIIGVRYELEMRPIMGLNPYVFAEDVDAEFLSLIKERGYPGVQIETTSRRVYHTTYGAHLLGYIALMDKKEYDGKYKELGYSYNATVGKGGAELAFEEYLHGADGLQAVTVDEDGGVVDVQTLQEPTAGSNVFLSIDIGLQARTEDSLAATIDLINASRTEEDRVTGGAVVVTDVRTGQVLASCSYPTYDLSTFLRNYTDLESNATNPLYNRAMSGLYNPGSTFKMVTALTGLKSGTITPSTLVNDTGKYTKYGPGFEPVCWIYRNTGHGHGQENVVTALRDSCNYFFYWLADNIGPAATAALALADTAADFGLGVETGIELPEKTGMHATPENKKIAFGDAWEGWFSANTIISAIGQDLNYFTPLQLSNYVATIANGGDRHRLTILSNIRSADFTSVILQQEPEVLGQVEGSEDLGVLQEGMRLVTAEGGTAASMFKNFRIPVAAKTGTVQTSQENAALNDGLFVCYAPANDPQIAISVVVEKGTSGSTIMQVAKDILDYYFREMPDIGAAGDNALLP